MKTTHKERGQAAIILVVFLPICVSMLGLALDIGQLHIAKAKVQTAVDAAALAGVSIAEIVTLRDSWGNVYNSWLEIDINLAEEVTQEYLEKNLGDMPGFEVTNTTVSTNVETRMCAITATATVKTNTTFLTMLGINTLETTCMGQAAAEIP